MGAHLRSRLSGANQAGGAHVIDFGHKAPINTSGARLGRGEDLPQRGFNRCSWKLALSTRNVCPRHLCVRPVSTTWLASFKRSQVAISGHILLLLIIINFAARQLIGLVWSDSIGRIRTRGCGQVIARTAGRSCEWAAGSQSDVGRIRAATRSQCESQLPGAVVWTDSSVASCKCQLLITPISLAARVRPNRIASNRHNLFAQNKRLWLVDLSRWLVCYRAAAVAPFRDVLGASFRSDRFGSDRPAQNPIRAEMRVVGERVRGSSAIQVESSRRPTFETLFRQNILNCPAPSQRAPARPSSTG